MNEMKGSRQFILQSIDPVLAMPSAEVRVLISDTIKLRAVLGLAENDDPGLRGRYHLSRSEMIEVGELCEPQTVPDQMLTVLEPWHSIRCVPYLVHTNFELPLMLDGRKPLAIFSGSYPNQWLDNYLAPFAPFVASGRFVRQSDYELFDDETTKSRSLYKGIKTIYFALPSERWRIDAHKLLKQVGQKIWLE